MRVPSIGLPLDERRIICEAYCLAERVLTDYRDPPSLLATTGHWLAQVRMTLLRG